MEANEIRQLAVDIDQFSYDVDYYEYGDSIGYEMEDRERNIQVISNDISQGKAEYLNKYLIEILDDDHLPKILEEAKKLLGRLTDAQEKIKT